MKWLPIQWTAASFIFCRNILLAKSLMALACRSALTHCSIWAGEQFFFVDHLFKGASADSTRPHNRRISRPGFGTPLDQHAEAKLLLRGIVKRTITGRDAAKEAIQN